MKSASVSSLSPNFTAAGERHNSSGGTIMLRTLFALVAGIGVGAGGLIAAQHHDDSEKVKVLSTSDISEKLDGKEATATVVEVTIEPGQAGLPHRHPGSAIGYVLEGEYELGIDNQPTKVVKAGETFYEPAGCLHRVSRNPGNVKTRLIAVVLHPRDAKQIAVPESKKD
jgi:quercetin dioxygenase-like cupin family protein